MTEPRIRLAVWFNEVMTRTQARQVLFAVIVCGLGGASVSGAAADAPVGTPGQSSDRLQQVEAASGAETPKRETAKGNGPPKRGQTTFQSSKARLSPARNPQLSGTLHGGNLTAHRSAELLLGAHSSTSKSALAASLAQRIPIRQSAVDRSVVGGPHTPGLGMIGGPANSRTVIKASIDGSALRRRY
jgi:hypothetical protein